MTQSPRHRVFVYGTLMRGESNHRYLERARFIAEARTEPRFELADFGDYPGMVEEGSVAITGEIYEVDDATLALLDELEEAPEHYRRVWIRVEVGEVQAYVLPAPEADGAPRLASGDWRRRALDRRR